MAEEQQQDGQKTIVAFTVGLLIGGFLVWAFSGPDANAPVEEGGSDTAVEQSSEENTSGEADKTNQTGSESTQTKKSDTPMEKATLNVGDGKVVVDNQPASASIKLSEAVYPISEGWIGVREYNNDNLGYILGVVRFSESQGLVPNEILLQRSTTPGNKYAVVIFTEDGDRKFNLGGDVQIDQIFDTFTAE